MLKIEFEFQTPEEAAIAMQAIVAARQTSAALPTPTTPAASPRPVPAPVAPVAPAPAPLPTQAPAPVPAQAPAAPPPAVAQQPSVPVAQPPTFTREQIMTAGAALIDAGKINELMGLLNSFGVQAVTQLKQEQLGAFATELRKLGAQI